MELWIRSQDRTKLCQARQFTLDNDQTGIFVFNGDEYSIFAGKYKTKERALEILDEIQNIIKPKVLLTRLGKVVGETYDGTVYSEPNEYEMQELSTAIYEMPKE